MRALLPVAIFFAGCTETGLLDLNPSKPDAVPGEIRGRVCSSDGRSWQGDALVYTNIIDSEGRLSETVQAYTDLDGNFVLEDLPGDAEYTVYVQVGDELTAYDPVYLPSGDVVELEEPACFDPLAFDVAVVTGDYDDFELVLSNMGFANYDVYDGLDQDEISGLLLDSELMSRYDVIFLNGGCLEEGVLYGEDAGGAETVLENLRGYVSNGGQIYVSDWAYDYVESTWPDALNFVGDDETIDAAQLGDYGSVSAAVTDASLAEWLGSNYVDIEYDLPVWPPVTDTEAYVSVHLSGSITYQEGTSETPLSNVPLLVSFTSGEGRVVFSSFRVAKNASSDMMLVLQYMLYNL